MTSKQAWFKSLMEDLISKGFGQTYGDDEFGYSFEVDVIDPDNWTEHKLLMKISADDELECYSLAEDSSRYGYGTEELLTSRSGKRFRRELLRAHMQVEDYLAKKKLGMETPELRCIYAFKNLS